jgi:hypothetical protein
MIPEFLLEKYGSEVCQIMMDDGRVKGENMRMKTHERQQMVVSHLHKIISELDLSFDINKEWAFDFPGWLGQINEEQHKKYMIIGMEPHIVDYDFQVVYGLTEKCYSQTGDDQAFKLEKGEKRNAISNYDSGLIWGNLFELIATDDEKIGVYQEKNLGVLIHFLEQFYITDMCHFAPRGKANEINKVVNFEKVPNWKKLRYNVADRFLEQEIEWVQPEIIIT